MNAKTKTKKGKSQRGATEIPSFEAAMNMEQVEIGERNCQKMDVTRRAMLAMLTKSSDEIYANFSDGKGIDLLIELIECVQSYKQHLATLQEFASTTEARLLSVGLRITETS